MKREYPPLFAPGFVDVTLEDFDRLFVEPFPGPETTRRHLVSRFRALVSVLREIGIECEVWIDGSFTTQKPEPDDIDVVILASDDSRGHLTVSKREELRRLLLKKDLTMFRYRCDLHYCDTADHQQIEKWENWFGFASDRKTPKGIARLKLKTS